MRGDVRGAIRCCPVELRDDKGLQISRIGDIYEIAHCHGDNELTKGRNGMAFSKRCISRCVAKINWSFWVKAAVIFALITFLAGVALSAGSGGALFSIILAALKYAAAVAGVTLAFGTITSLAQCLLSCA